MESPVRPHIPDGTRLIETFGWRSGQGAPLLPLHLARLERSARVLGYACPTAAIQDDLAMLDSPDALRCRLTLARGGDWELTTAPMPEVAPIWRFEIAHEPVQADDFWLRHKTTQRAQYDLARAQMPAGIQELVFLNERGELCEGTITNLMLTMPDGARLTPPQVSGCLPGIYRQQLLAQGDVRESVLTLDDMRAAHGITLMNALRGPIAAIWVEGGVEIAPQNGPSDQRA